VKQHEIQNRPNPQIDIGAVDMSCSFVVTDNRLHDNPIVYVSPTFEVLTEYSKWEIRGKNCRFLQSPHGKVDAGSVRTFTDGETVRYFKRQLERGREAQATLLNYRKGGMPFVNLLTMIPVSWDGQKNALFVGFQIDLVDHPEAIQKRNKSK
jgi:PAS domain-containing protein